MRRGTCEGEILYRGQTSRSGYERINEHFRDWLESKTKPQRISTGEQQNGNKTKRKGDRNKESTP